MEWLRPHSHCWCYCKMPGVGSLTLVFDSKILFFLFDQVKLCIIIWQASRIKWALSMIWCRVFSWSVKTRAVSLYFFFFFILHLRISWQEVMSSYDFNEKHAHGTSSYYKVLWFWVFWVCFYFYGAVIRNHHAEGIDFLTWQLVVWVERNLICPYMIVYFWLVAWLDL